MNMDNKKSKDKNTDKIPGKTKYNMKNLINVSSQEQIKALGSFMVAVNVFLAQIAKDTQRNEEQEKTLNDSARSHSMSAAELLEKADSCDDEEDALLTKEAAKEHKILADKCIQDLASDRTLIDTMSIWQTLDDEFLKLKVSFNSNAPQLAKDLISEVDIIQPVIEANSQPLQFPKPYQSPIIARQVRAYKKRDRLPVKQQKAITPEDIAELRAPEKRNNSCVEQQKNRTPEKAEAALQTLRRLAGIFKTSLPLLPVSTETTHKKKKRRKRKIKITDKQKEIWENIKRGATVSELAAGQGCSETNIRQQCAKADEKIKKLSSSSRSINFKRTQKIPTDKRGQEIIQDNG